MEQMTNIRLSSAQASETALSVASDWTPWAVAAAKRDVLICDLLMRGYRNRGIAHALGLSLKSVEKYRKHIRATLQAAACQQQAA